MALDIGTLVAKVKVDDSDFDAKTKGWSTRGAAVGSAFGNVAADAISQAASALGGFISEAVAASDATDKFKSTLEFAGLDNSTIEGLAKSTRAYADETVYSLTDIQSITAQLASNGVKDYDVLAESLGNLNAVAGGSAETYGRVGMVLTQTAGQGKLTTENWNQLAEAIPGASGVLMNALKDAGAYTGNFRDAMSEGQITAEEFNAALMLVGQDPIAVEAAKSTETMEGAIGNLSASVQGKLMDAISAIKPALTGFLGGLTTVFNFITENQPILAGLAAGLLYLLAPSLWALVTATWAWTAALLANPVTWIVIGIVALVAAIVWLVQNWDVAVAWIEDVWGAFTAWVVSVTEGFVGWWNGVWAGFASWITGVWEGFIGWIEDTWNGFIAWINSSLRFLLAVWNLTWQMIGDAIQSIWSGFTGWVRGIAQGFISFLLGAFNGFVSFWSGLWTGVSSTVQRIWGGIVSFFQGIPNRILGFFTGAGKWLMDVGASIIQGLIDGINSMIGAVGDAVGGVLDFAAGFFPHSPAKRGPLSGSGWYAIGEAGEAVMDQFAGGLGTNAINKEFARMLEVAPLTYSGPATAAPVAGPSKTIHYYAAEHQSLSSEEALFAALGSPRVKED